ncbi:MAG: PhoH family protein [Alphaproteobacteria bacterium]
MNKQQRPATAHPAQNPQEEGTLVIDFDDNALLPELFGEYDRNLALIEDRLGVRLSSRGNRVSISGSKDIAKTAKAVLRSLYGRLRNGLGVNAGDVEGAVRLAEANAEKAAGAGAPVDAIRTRRRVITPRSQKQAEYVARLRDSELVFATGPAGTGKTYLAVAVAVELLQQGVVDRLILSRPAVEAGERIGFLPGDMRDKIDPYLRPLYDALHDMQPGDQVVKGMANGDIEVAPLGFMRGRTLSNAFVILDEAQNTTPMQMKMFLTRLGENSRMVVCGDPSQVDLPMGSRSGLQDALEVLGKVDGVSFVKFGEADVVRHRLVTRMVQAYNSSEEQKRLAAIKRRKPAGDAAD